MKTRRSDFVKVLAAAVDRRDQHRKWAASLDEPRATYERQEADRKLEAYFAELFDALADGMIVLEAPPKSGGEK